MFVGSRKTLEKLIHFIVGVGCCCSCYHFNNRITNFNRKRRNPIHDDGDDDYYDDDDYGNLVCRNDQKVILHTCEDME
jgi:hypothetical protein